MDELKNIVGDVIKDIYNKKKFQEVEVVKQAWRDMVGAEMSCHSAVVYLTKEQIKVNVDSPTRLFQLNLRRGSLQKKMREIVGNCELKIQLGEV